MKNKTECVRFCGNFMTEREAFTKIFSFKFCHLKLKIKAYKSRLLQKHLNKMLNKAYDSGIRLNDYFKQLNN